MNWLRLIILGYAKGNWQYGAKSRLQHWAFTRGDFRFSPCTIIGLRRRDLFYTNTACHKSDGRIGRLITILHYFHFFKEQKVK